VRVEEVSTMDERRNVVVVGNMCCQVRSVASRGAAAVARTMCTAEGSETEDKEVWPLENGCVRAIMWWRVCVKKGVDDAVSGGSVVVVVVQQTDDSVASRESRNDARPEGSETADNGQVKTEIAHVRAIMWWRRCVSVVVAARRARADATFVRAFVSFDGRSGGNGLNDEVDTRYRSVTSGRRTCDSNSWAFVTATMARRRRVFNIIVVSCLFCCSSGSG
jgi:hypothetical protein